MQDTSASVSYTHLELLAINKQRNEWRLVGAILLVVLLLLYLLSVYKRERVKKERRIDVYKRQVLDTLTVFFCTFVCLKNRG